MGAAPDHANLRTEIAATAARLIAEEGIGYGRAKRRAAQLLLGAHSNSRSVLPDNAQVESELRRHLQTFAGDTHPALLAALRRLAAQWLARLAQFNPHVVGSVLNGTATEHSDLHLHLFTDNVKDVEMYLLNERIAFDVGEGAGANEVDGCAMPPEEVVSFVVQPVAGSGLPARIGVVLAIHRTDAQATLYRPGDFLTVHDDSIGGHKRLAAYVLNLTPIWRADWGGVLQFLGTDGHVEEGYVPCFNALNVFRVPTQHLVSQVALYGSSRYSITGWFHAR